MTSTRQENPTYLNYWGKAQPAVDGQPSWHPAAYHGLDVAAVGAALLEARPQLLATLARASGLQLDLARRWFLLALALHDIGKFACCFQTKVKEHFAHRDLWTALPLVADPGHGRTSLALWAGGCDIAGIQRQVFTPLFGSTPQAIDAHFCFDHWMAAVAGHHGRPVEPDSLGNRICVAALNDARAYIEDCAALFNPRLPPDAPKLREPAFKRSSWLVAGLTMLCDWIGSNQEWYPYTEPTHSLGKYWERVQKQACDALTKAGMTAPPIAKHFALGDALPNVEKPDATPLQRWATEEAAVNGQTLAIIEDLTGAGKTEAGLLLAHRLMASGAAEGLYWALPTMATADALYRRLAVSYQHMFSDTSQASLMLAHSASSFNDVFTKSIFDPKPGGVPIYGASEGENDNDITASAACARWLADDRRKTFLADIGVGTIDQALLGVLPSKHQALRLAALSRRVLVVDEAHSYDPYMTKLLETLLEFQGALGGSAIVMSATLTMEARNKFTAAFARGAGWAKPEIAETGFPLATLVSQGQPLTERVLSASRGTRRDLPVHRLDDENAALETLKAAADQGRAAVWIRNTVQDALDAYEKLHTALPDVPLDLFHARFALGDRLSIEKRVLENFGKNSAGEQRRRILIATQVVEQSLDCDWDVMISDLAPVDLLIQRAGRLHRHDRGGRPSPMLHVVSPDPVLDAGEGWYKALFQHAAWVYQHHGQLWLTMRALLDAGGLKLATQSPRALIERVFAEESTEIPAGLAAQSAKAMGKALGERAVAKMNGLELKSGYVHQAGAWASDTKTPTRLGADTRVLRLAKWDGTKLAPWWSETGDMRRAWRLSEVSVRAGMVASVDYSDAALAKAVKHEIAGWPEKYDPPLLVALTKEGGVWVAKVKGTKDRVFNLNYYRTKGLNCMS